MTAYTCVKLEFRFSEPGKNPCQGYWEAAQQSWPLLLTAGAGLAQASNFNSRFTISSMLLHQHS